MKFENPEGSCGFSKKKKNNNLVITKSAIFPLGLGIHSHELIICSLDLHTNSLVLQFNPSINTTRSLGLQFVPSIYTTCSLGLQFVSSIYTTRSLKLQLASLP